jgi:uncharacterized protein (TIGR02594 family)
MLNEPKWLLCARKDVGLREIAGAKHEPRITQMLIRLGAWWRDDETPWCGVAVGNWMFEAEVQPPAAYYRAKEWLKWGIPCEPQVGAVAVFDRAGGGHVALIIGQTEAGHLVCLGGNQRDMVCLAAFNRDRLLGCRWPIGRMHERVPGTLPTVSWAQLSANEA